MSPLQNGKELLHYGISYPNSSSNLAHPNGSPKEKSRAGLPSARWWPQNTCQHLQVQPSGPQDASSPGSQKDLEICHERDGTPDVPHDTRCNKAVWAKGISNVLYCIRCSCPENLMRMNTHQTSSVTGYLYTWHNFEKWTANQYGWELTTAERREGKGKDPYHPLGSRYAWR